MARSPRGVITLDWMLLAVAAIAVLLLIGTMIRISTGDDARRGGDLFALHDGDDLLAFQDFSFDAPGWVPETITDRLPGIGPVLGPFTNEAVQRGFELPVSADTVQMVFDLHMMGPWSAEDVLLVSLGEVEVLRLGAAEPLGAVASPGIRLEADRWVIAPNPPETALPGTMLPITTHRIRIAIADPGETLVLRLGAQAGDDATWALDNLTVVATAGDGA